MNASLLRTIQRKVYVNGHASRMRGKEEEERKEEK